ncbi:DEAD/DEAH box helicase [Tenacibaculum litopenaei]|uniref:DEAD/DEAH box helicase n=1 Tax=Tenacibaculum litopenaei TaxID=396016 RepID=UPI0038942CA2
MSKFKELGVAASYVKGLTELGIQEPTEIQEAIIPYLLNNAADLVGLAQTGTGKTAAFGLPLLNRIDTDKKEIQALILTPTRELAQQVKHQLFKYTKYVPERIFMEAVFGGEKIAKQIANLQRTTHVVVATPGRLIDLIEQGAINLKQLDVLVLDEADEMLSMGFKEDLQRILRYTPKTKHTWLFSATMPEAVSGIIKKYLQPEAKQVRISKPLEVNKNISHLYITTPSAKKTAVLTRYLQKHQKQRGIVYARTKAGAQRIATALKERGLSVEALEGGMQQRERDKVMRMFKKGSIQTLISTDVSSRGIDVSKLDFVFHYQLPEQDTVYTHRSGRTARAGSKGVSIVLATNKDRGVLDRLSRTLQITFKEFSF